MEGHAQPLGHELPTSRTRPFARALESARASAWALALLSALALALRLTSLGRSLFNDETFSFALAQRGFGHMIALAGYEANGMPYSILLWPLTRIFGTSVEVMRAPAVLIGTASVPAIYWAARAFSRDRRVALLAAALLAINPMAIWYSQVARSYALVVLGACVAFGALARALEDRDRRGMWWLYIAAMALTAYSDLLAPVVVLPAQALMTWRAAGVSERRTALLKRWAYSLVAIAAACIPLIVAALIERGRRDPLYWLPKLGRGLVEAGVQEFAGGFSGVKAVGWLSLLTAAVLVGAAALRLRSRGDGQEARAERSTLAVAAAWGVLPPAGLLLVSAVVPVFWPRYAIVALPGLCLLLALSAARLSDGRSGRLLAGSCVAALACLSLYADAKQVDAVQQEWKPVASWLRAQRTPSQPLIVDSVLTLPSLGYYDPALRARNGNLVVAEWGDTALPPQVLGFKDPAGHGGSTPDGPPSISLVRGLARAHGTVWLLFAETSERAEEDPAVRWASAHCHVATLSRTRIEAVRISGCPKG
jgi:mannosyltransferase